MNSATAAAAAATVSIRLGKLNSVVSTVKEFEGLTRAVFACQEGINRSYKTNTSYWTYYCFIQ